jgi:hypothetical protein
MGFILIGTLGIANLVMARRLPPIKAQGGLLNLKAFKYPPYAVYCLSGFCSFLGLFTGEQKVPPNNLTRLTRDKPSPTSTRVQLQRV